MTDTIHINLDATEFGNRLTAHKMIIQLIWNTLAAIRPDDAELIKSACLKAAEDSKITNPENLFAEEMAEIFASIGSASKPTFSVIQGGKSGPPPPEPPPER